MKPQAQPSFYLTAKSSLNVLHTLEVDSLLASNHTEPTTYLDINVWSSFSANTTLWSDTIFD